MGLRDDLERFREVGEQRREDLADFIRYGDLSSGDIRVPIKIVELPEFAYDRRDVGGVGQGEGGTPDPGQKVGDAEADGDDGDGDGDQAGEGGGDHDYYEMDPEEFAAELDEELGLDLEPKGKEVLEEVEGEFTDVARSGPSSTLDVDHLFTEGLKRKLATDFDENYVEEALRVQGWGPDEVFAWARGENLPVSRAWIVDRAADLDDPGRWPSIEAMTASVDRERTVERIRREGVRHVPFRRADERFRHPEVTERRERNVVVVNIRDVSGSMREDKRELVERTFTPLDWYLSGKYDRAEFLYIAHDADAWQVERADFFGIRSGGGTRISSAYELAADLLEAYPFSEWNRYVFAAGDGENSHDDTRDNVVPLMADMAANLHAYVETRPERSARTGTHGAEVADAFADADDVVVTSVGDADDVLDAIRTILTTETQTDAPR